MRYHIIYFLDYKKNDSVTIKEMYMSKDDAFNNIEKVAIDYIKELQGKQQADICKQDKTPEQLLADISTKEGMYIRKYDDHVIIYEKTTVVVPGTLWNSNTLQVNKIAQISVMEYNFDDMLFNCSCKIERKQRITIPIIPSQNNQKNNSKLPTYNFMDELKIKMNSGMIKLKPVN